MTCHKEIWTLTLTNIVWSGQATFNLVLCIGKLAKKLSFVSINCNFYSYFGYLKISPSGHFPEYWLQYDPRYPTYCGKQNCFLFIGMSGNAEAKSNRSVSNYLHAIFERKV